MPEKTAYVTGGASGIGRAVVEMLVDRGIRVCIADQNRPGAESVASKLGKGSIAVQVDAADWDSQVQGFQKAVDEFGGRIDYVYPIAGIGERRFTPEKLQDKGFVRPDLTTVDIDLNGVLYTSSLAVQQFRRQDKDEKGFRGKIAVTASVCGFYCVPTIPIYTAAKHGVVGFVRSLGKYLPEENITLNAVCPNVVKTNISTPDFYEKIDAAGLDTPIKAVVAAFESFIESDISGECMEVGPSIGVCKAVGFVPRAPAEHLDPETGKVMDMLYGRSHSLQEVKG